MRLKRPVTGSTDFADEKRGKKRGDGSFALFKKNKGTVPSFLGTGYGMYVPPMTICDNLDQDVEEFADNPYWWKADSIEELAQMMGVDPEAAAATKQIL